LSIGIGVNVNYSPVPKISTCLKEITGAAEEINVDDFVRRLASNLMRMFQEADKSGFQGALKANVEKRLDFLN